jgi:hypothetical protein
VRLEGWVAIITGVVVDMGTFANRRVVTRVNNGYWAGEPRQNKEVDYRYF